MAGRQNLSLAEVTLTTVVRLVDTSPQSNLVVAPTQEDSVVTPQVWQNHLLGRPKAKASSPTHPWPAPCRPFLMNNTPCKEQNI